mmetsp:Transcript_13561/g.15970  ORF Transcript_13561/g.15970 Transcript_13561/m.15970 type:complete len:250 (+) Transcript_13561:68-817(+)
MHFSVAASISFPTRNASSSEIPGPNFPSLPFLTTSCAPLLILRTLCLVLSAVLPNCLTIAFLLSALTLGMGTITAPSSTRGLKFIPMSLTASLTDGAVSGSKHVIFACVGLVITTCATALRGVTAPYAFTCSESNKSGVGSAPLIERNDASIAKTTFIILPSTSSTDGREGVSSELSSNSTRLNIVSFSSSSRTKSSNSPMSGPRLAFVFFCRLSFASLCSTLCASSSNFWRCFPIFPALRPNVRIDEP